MKRKYYQIFASVVLGFGLMHTQAAFAADEPCSSVADATAIIQQVISEGSSAAAALAEAMNKHSCSVEAVVQAALQSAPESEYSQILQVAQTLASPDQQDQVVSGAILAGIDPTQYLQAPAAGPAAGAGGAGLPPITNRGGGGGGFASPS